jgi:hypothetical protein
MFSRTTQTLVVIRTIDTIDSIAARLSLIAKRTISRQISLTHSVSRTTQTLAVIRTIDTIDSIAARLSLIAKRTISRQISLTHSVSRTHKHNQFFQRVCQ